MGRSDMTDLKPCPFCGAEARLEPRKIKVRKAYAVGRNKKVQKVYYSIGCSNPDCLLCNTKNQLKLLFTVSRDGLDTVIRRWNMRVET